MNLKPRFHVLTILLFVVSAIPAWFAVRTLAEGVVEQWAIRYAEKQVLYDKSRTLQPILREVALSRQLASSQYIREWARDPGDPERAHRAMVELESFRLNFADHSYFIALEKTGQYFHNNADNEFAGRELRYTLDRKQTKDAWYYDLIKQGRDIHINVNPDPALGITKLWIDVLIRDGNDILGITGTGLDLTTFINNVVEEGVPGVTSLFIDHDGAIQLHRNQTLIDFASITKSTGDRKTVDLLFDHDADRNLVLAAMKELEGQKKTVATAFVSVNGKRHLAGIAFLPEIAWYEITLMDLEILLPFSNFAGIMGIYALTLLGSLILFNLALNRFILRPLQTLNQAMAAVEAGAKVPAPFSLMGTGEIRLLMQRFVRMADAVFDARRDLESKVVERTIALERLTKIDPLTELFNRRGMTERLEDALNRFRREGSSVGILWLDIDNFKQINDTKGHAVGDEVLKTIAGVIDKTIRPYDVASRWGGDEFLIMLQPADFDLLTTLGERLRTAIAGNTSVLSPEGEPVFMTASIGGHLAAPGETLDAMLQHGDQSLYEAKAAGRNCYRLSAASVARGAGVQTELGHS